MLNELVMIKKIYSSFFVDDDKKIFSLQLQYFRILRDVEGNLLKHNFRPVQPIGDRVVWLTSSKLKYDDVQGQKKSKRGKSDAHYRKNSNFPIFVLLILITYQQIFLELIN